MPAYFTGRLSRLGITALAVFVLLCGRLVLAGAQEPAHPRWELYAGYSALDTGASIHGIFPGGVAPSTACLCWDPRGFGATLTYKFLPWFGVTGDIGGVFGSHESTPFERFDHASFYNISAGPQFTYHIHHVSPFAEFLAGGHRLTPELFHPNDVFGFMAGGGVDLNFSRHFAFRLIHADYVFSNHQFGPSATVAATNLRGARLQAGVVFMFGGAGAMIAQPQIVQPSPMPHAQLAMPVIQAPRISCSAMPMAVQPGESSLITANGISARPLTYNFNATAGSIIGTNATAILSTAGAGSGIITVTCTVTDDQGQTAAQTTQVTVAAATVTAKAETSSLCSISFQRDMRRPTRVDNEAKACLDEIALGLERSPDTTLAIIGNEESKPGESKALAAQRAVNTKAYLVQEKGIDASRIKVYTGVENANTVSNISVPSGAALDTIDYTLIDENDIKPLHTRLTRNTTQSH
jgi:outer membrane protein OmpA-like peptidoglycan-associated protein